MCAAVMFFTQSIFIMLNNTYNFRCLLRGLFGLDGKSFRVEMANTAVTEVNYVDGRWVMQSINVPTLYFPAFAIQKFYA